jgi:hypothetical protein
MLPEYCLYQRSMLQSSWSHCSTLSVMVYLGRNCIESTVHMSGGWQYKSPHTAGVQTTRYPMAYSLTKWTGSEEKLRKWKKDLWDNGSLPHTTWLSDQVSPGMIFPSAIHSRWCMGHVRLRRCDQRQLYPVLNQNNIVTCVWSRT